MCHTCGTPNPASTPSLCGRTICTTSPRYYSARPSSQPDVEPEAVVAPNDVVKAGEHLQVALVLVEHVGYGEVHGSVGAKSFHCVAQAQVRHGMRWNVVFRNVDAFHPRHVAHG